MSLGTRASITCDTSMPKTPTTTPPAPSTPTTSVKTPRNPLTPQTSKSPRNPSNKFWIQEQRRKSFLAHMKRWCLSHDSSNFFQGKLSLLPSEPDYNEDLALGRCVNCILTDSSFTDYRKTVSVKLFGPQNDSRDSKRRKLEGNMDSKTRETERNMDSKILDLSSSTTKLAEDKEEEAWTQSQDKSDSSNSYYKLVIRFGSGWLSARDYFNRLYFRHLAARLPGRHGHCITDTADYAFRVRSQALGPPPAKRDTVSIQPLFHPFQRLPAELQEMILMTAAGLSQDYDLTNDARKNHARAAERAISLSTMLRISRHTHDTMRKYILHSTTFHFGLSGTTNFLWQTGPIYRPHIKRLAFHLGKNALLHCVRWLAADRIFEFLEPPQPNGGSGLPLFWRCQLRALAKEVHLLDLVIDVEGIPKADIAMVVRIMRDVFGSVERVRFEEGYALGKPKVLDMGDERLANVGKGVWREMVKGYIKRYERQIGWHNWHFKMDLVGLKEDEVDALMDKDGDFFDS